MTESTTFVSNAYYLFTFNGALYLNEIANYRSTWVQLTDNPDCIGAYFPCEPPRRQARRDWGEVISTDLEGAISKFQRLGVIGEARQYLTDLVQGLTDGWENELITNFDQSGFEVNDFIPFSRIPAKREAYQAALHARAGLVGELDELLDNYPLAEDWLELIGHDTISDIRTGIDDYEITLFENSELTVIEAIRQFQRYGSDTDYSEWAENYLDNSAEEFDSREHYRDCAGLFEEGVQMIEGAIIDTRVSLIEASEVKMHHTNIINKKDLSVAIDNIQRYSAAVQEEIDCQKNFWQCIDQNLILAASEGRWPAIWIRGNQVAMSSKKIFQYLSKTLEIINNYKTIPFNYQTSQLWLNREFNSRHQVRTTSIWDGQHNRAVKGVILKLIK